MPFTALRRFLLSPPSCRDPEVLRPAVSGRTVLITGASYGIGEATAYLLAGAGAEVILLARSAERLNEVAGHIRHSGGRAHAYALDLYRSEDVAPLLAFIQTQHPRIDMVVSNAGKSIRRSVLHSLPGRDLERSLAVNFSSPAQLVAALLPGMLARGGGRIVNVSSVAARMPGAPRWASYQSSKAGFDLWLHGAVTELNTRGVTAASVYLPLVHTRMSAATPIYTRLPGLSPLDAAQAVAYALISGRRRVAPWWLFWAELGATLLPGLTHRALLLSERFTPPDQKR